MHLSASTHFLQSGSELNFGVQINGILSNFDMQQNQMVNYLMSQQKVNIYENLISYLNPMKKIERRYSGDHKKYKKKL